MQSDNIERITPFNPLSKTNLGESVADALLARPVTSLPPSQFVGAGIYSIYYHGNHPAYLEIAEMNMDDKFLWPIYVGKAVPAGARKGGFGLDEDPGVVLFKRLSEHAMSIQQTENLAVEHFSCRFLVVEDIWIPLAESLLIQMFSPLWNKYLDGFGNHDPGRGRYQQQRSPWDTLHPGRPWAKKLKTNSSNVDSIQAMVRSYISEKRLELFSR